MYLKLLQVRDVVNCNGKHPQECIRLNFAAPYGKRSIPRFALGLSRYEISIDSRITKWLNALEFPVKLTANALQDRNYYNFVSDGFQRLCEACEIMPCVLDAAIFSSFDEGKWTEDKVVW